MSDKAALLEQLRIDPVARPESTGRRLGAGARSGLLMGIALIVAAAGGVAYWRVSQIDAVPVQAVIARALASSSTHAPVMGPVLAASGYVVALRDATVSAKAIYEVKRVLVQQGERVTAGQVIAVLDDSNVRASLEQSVAQMRQAQAELAQSRIAAEDGRPIFLSDQKELAEGLISPDAFDTTKGTYDAAHTQVEVAEQNLAVDQAAVMANQQLEKDTVIRAPFDGVVTAVNAQPGQIVSPQFSGGGGLAEVVDMNSLEVDVDVSESFISRVYPHQPATITLDAYPDWHIPAKVIAIVPTADKAKGTVEVRVGFKQKSSRILPQMGARVSFLAGSPSASGSSTGTSPPGSGAIGNTAVAVPVAAVETGGNSSTGTVFVINGNTVSARMVRLGALSGDQQRILSGLDPGASVAIGNLGKLHDGVKVRIEQ